MDEDGGLGGEAMYSRPHSQSVLNQNLNPAKDGSRAQALFPRKLGLLNPKEDFNGQDLGNRVRVRATPHL